MSQELAIIAEGKHWLVVDKPAEQSVHNEKGADLISAVKAHVGQETVFVINRLDVGVRGLVLVGLEKQVATELHKQFAERTVEKEYRGVGVPQSDKTLTVGEKGLWKKPLTKKAESRRNPAGFGGMRVPCRTEFEVLSHSDQGVTFKLNPMTGRKHQLRRHAALAGFPLRGDRRYGPKDQDAADIALTAVGLRFVDPTTTQTVSVRLPDALH